MSSNSNSIKRFGTFSGVFVPTILTILGVILFLRTSWIVGEGGLFGALLIIAVCFLLTILTGLSTANMVTNTDVGVGGMFFIVNKVLGPRLAGTIALPLYLSQAIVVAMYIFGFRDGWLWIFPNHSPLIVDLVVFGLIFAIARVSTSFAFKIQYFILAALTAGLLSVFLGGFKFEPQGDQVLWGAGLYEGGNAEFWRLLKIFFPASTGILVGVNMSGELKNPKKSIPLGMLSAIGITWVIYSLFAIWSWHMGSEKELQDNYLFSIDHAFESSLVLLALLGATFSSGLASFVAAPRILQALGNHRLVPFGYKLSNRNGDGDPVNAMYVTSIISFFALTLRELNAIAPLITMIFLAAYLILHLSTFLQARKSKHLFTSFTRFPKTVAFIGFFGSILMMYLINPLVALIAWIILFLFYLFLPKGKKQT